MELPILGGQKTTQTNSSIHSFIFFKILTCARSRQVLSTDFSKTGGRNICCSSLDRALLRKQLASAMFVPPLTIACTMHGSRAICSGPTLVGQHNEEDACARPFRDSQLCAQTPIPCGCFSSWVQNLILAHPEIWLRIKFYLLIAEKGRPDKIWLRIKFLKFYVCCRFLRDVSKKRPKFDSQPKMPFPGS